MPSTLVEKKRLGEGWVVLEKMVFGDMFLGSYCGCVGSVSLFFLLKPFF